VRSTIEKHRMLSRGDRVVVAVSGGPDSVAMLHVLWSLKEEYELDLRAAHLNHGFRGDEADRDAEYVGSLCKRLDVPLTCEKLDVPRLAEAWGLAAQQAARRARYRFLARVALEAGASTVALGHNLDDQVETLLMRFLRGAGLDGLAGIPPVREVSARELGEALRTAACPRIAIVRPLVETPRRAIERYCADQGLHPRVDSSNLKPVYLRNRIRAELLPLIRDRYNPNVDGVLQNMVSTLRADLALLRELAEKAWSDVRAGRDAAPSLDADRFRTLPLALQRRVLRLALEEAGVDLSRLEFVHVESVRDLALRGREGAVVHLPGGMLAGRRGASVAFAWPARRRGRSFRPRGRFTVARRGVTRLDRMGLEVEARVVEAPVQGPHPCERPVAPGEEGRPARAWFDAESAAGPLLLRFRRAGDRFEPLGVGGTKKLKDFFIDRKVSADRRDAVPLLLSGSDIMWVVGYRIDERFKVTPQTRSVLIVEVRGVPRR